MAGNPKGPDSPSDLGRELYDMEAERGVADDVITNIAPDLHPDFQPASVPDELEASVKRHPAGGNVPARVDKELDDEDAHHPALSLTEDKPRPINTRVGQEFQDTAENYLPELRAQIQKIETPEARVARERREALTAAAAKARAAKISKQMIDNAQQEHDPSAN